MVCKNAAKGGLLLMEMIEADDIHFDEIKLPITGAAIENLNYTIC
jgi:hypothetical protein